MHGAQIFSTATTPMRSRPPGPAGVAPARLVTHWPIGSRPRLVGSKSRERGSPLGNCGSCRRQINAGQINTELFAEREIVMAIERTLSIIKPDATRRNLTGTINNRFEQRGLRIVAQKRLQLSEAQAERFYEVHAQRSFYRALVASMISGPIVVQVLEGADAVALNREIMGATNPAD